MELNGSEWIGGAVKSVSASKEMRDACCKACATRLLASNPEHGSVPWFALFFFFFAVCQLLLLLRFRGLEFGQNYVWVLMYWQTTVMRGPWVRRV